MQENKSLIELAQTAAFVESELIKTQGELTPELIEILCDLEIDLPQKIDAYKLIIERSKSIADEYKARAESFSKVAKGLDNFHKSLKDNLKSAMEITQKHELIGNDYTFKLSERTTTLKINEDLLPDELKVEKTVYEPNKELIRKMLEDGINVPGAKLETCFALLTQVRRK